MDQQRDQSAMSDSAAKVGEKVGNVAAQAQGSVQDAIDRGKPMLNELQAKAGEAMGQATDMARKASSAGVQAVNQASDAVQGAARQVSGQASQAASKVYEQSAWAGGHITRYTAEQPLTALLIAAAIGYGIAYLIHRQ
ncbi:MAG: hypothetical protein JO139_14620 [Alphaproteobacteria bacterium]|nr:hypothetical protein [Alphaproteobacteria bacterium]